MEGIQLEAIKKMSPAKKLEIAAQLWHEARRLKEASLRAFYPAWPAEKVREKAREAFLYARS